MAKKRYYHVTINYEPFILDSAEIVDAGPLRGYDDIREVHGRCSDAKKAIWDEWEYWFYSHEGYCVVASANSRQFSIDGYFTDKATGARFYAHITKTYNRCWMVSGNMTQYTEGK